MVIEENISSLLGKWMSCNKTQVSERVQWAEEFRELLGSQEKKIKGGQSVSWCFPLRIHKGTFSTNPDMIHKAYTRMFCSEEGISELLQISSSFIASLDRLRHKKCKNGEEGEIKSKKNDRTVHWWYNLACKALTWVFFALLHFWRQRIHYWDSIPRNSNAHFSSQHH